jgi:hypothetical protein
MEFLLNDLSLHGQFDSTSTFIAALDRIMVARQSIQRRGMRLRCRKFQHARINETTTVLQALQSMRDRNKRSGILLWMTKDGPFWEEERLHTGDDFFEVDGAVVTDTAVGEAAMQILQGTATTLVSFTPSSWERTPIEVARVHDDESRTTVSVPNVWTQAQIDATLQEAERPLQSWSDLVRWAQRECSHLALAPDVIASLEGWPFVPGAAERFQVLLGTLDRLKQCVGKNNRLNAAGLAILQNYFVGEEARFTDSSDGEKREFKNELTFPHPERPGETLFCPWHGKVKTPQMRVHFSYPIKFDEPLYIVYIGPKITKR